MNVSTVKTIPINRNRYETFLFPSRKACSQTYNQYDFEVLLKTFFNPWNMFQPIFIESQYHSMTSLPKKHLFGYYGAEYDRFSNTSLQLLPRVLFKSKNSAYPEIEKIKPLIGRPAAGSLHGISILLGIVPNCLRSIVPGKIYVIGKFFRMNFVLPETTAYRI